MGSWSAVAAAAPELAHNVQARFEATGLGLLATLRKDGSPRLTGIEPLFAEGELWLGMMPDSLKAADLQRDGRFALHAATTDKDVKEGDAKLNGVAVEVVDGATKAAFQAGFKEQRGQDIPPGPFHLFRLDVQEMSFLRPVGGEYLEITVWREGQDVRRIERR